MNAKINADGYRNGYNGADLKSDVAKALWVRILHHPPACGLFIWHESSLQNCLYWVRLPKSTPWRVKHN